MTALRFALLLQLPRSRPVCVCQARSSYQNIFSHTSLSFCVCVCVCVYLLVNLDIFWLCMLSGCPDTSSQTQRRFESFRALPLLLLLQGVALLLLFHICFPFYLLFAFADLPFPQPSFKSYACPPVSSLAAHSLLSGPHPITSLYRFSSVRTSTSNSRRLLELKLKLFYSKKTAAVTSSTSLSPNGLYAVYL